MCITFLYCINITLGYIFSFILTRTGGLSCITIQAPPHNQGVPSLYIHRPSASRARLVWSVQGGQKGEKDKMKHLTLLALALTLIATICVAKSPYQSVLQHSRIRGRQHG